MRTNTNSHQAITIKDQPLENVDEFVYLGSNISTDGEAEKDVELCINKARRTPSEHSDLYGSLPNSPKTQKSEFSTQM